METSLILFFGLVKAIRQAALKRLDAGLGGWLKNRNLNDSVAVNTCIAAHKVADSYKRNLARAYS